MNPIAIVAAMPQELAALREPLEGAREERFFGKSLQRGRIGAAEVVLTLSGIGKVNAAFSTALVIDRFSPRAVINSGSAGALGAGIAVGDVVIGDRVAHHDVDLRAFGHQIGQLPDLPAAYPADSTLVAQTVLAARGGGVTVHQGLIVSGDRFIHDTARTAPIREAFPAALACDMEAAAIAQVSHLCGVPFVAIRAISDHADEQANTTFDAFIEHAGKQSATLVHRLLGILNG